MSDRHATPRSHDSSSDELRERAEDAGPPEETPVQGASRATTPPHPPHGRTDPDADPDLAPGAR